MKNHQLINQSSGKVNYYTPADILEAARKTMGGWIDLDPASDEIGNRSVKAIKYYAEADDGLSKPWFGKVWLNHPFGRGEEPCKLVCKKKICFERGHHISERIPNNADWIDKLTLECIELRVETACCITYACTSEKWFKPLLRMPQCFLHGRTNFLDESGLTVKGVTKGCVVTYFGKNLSSFVREFRHLGTIKIMVFDTDGRNETKQK